MKTVAAIMVGATDLKQKAGERQPEKELEQSQLPTLATPRHQNTKPMAVPPQDI